MLKNTDLPVSMAVLYHFHHMAERVGALLSADHPDLSPGEMNVLIRLTTPMALKQMAEQHNCQPSNMTTLVAKSVDKGWLEKTRSETDARSVLVSLTDAGMLLREQLMEDVQRHIQDVSQIPDDIFGQIWDRLK